MVRQQPYSIMYDRQVRRHLRFIEKKHHALIRRTIEDQLRFQPQVETRNRKPLLREADFDAEWELRFGPDNRFRVFYAIDSAHREVQVLAIGIKSGNRLSIGGEEVEL
jgi:mRNA-degrading endonuclease RelE of RelBE toxin-antitoxin system